MDEFDRLEITIAAYKNRLETRPDELSNYWNLGLAFLLNHEDFAAQEVWFAGITADDGGESDRRLATLIEFLKRKSREYQKNYYPERSELIDYQLLDLDGDSPEIYVHLGDAIALQGRLDEAVPWWVKATEINPDLFDVYCQCGIVLQKLEKFTDAIHFYLTALSLKPDPEIFCRLGICYLKTEQLQKALDAFRRAIKIEPNFADAIADLGWVLLRLQRHEEGMQNWKSALQIEPNFARFYCANIADSERDRIRREFLNGLLDDCQTPDFLQLLEKLLSLHGQSPQRDRIPPSNPVEPPQLFYESTRDWAVSANQQYKAIEPETTLKLKPPKTPDHSVHFSFRFGSKLTLPASFITVVPEGRYWLDPTQTKSAVIAANNHFLADLSPDFPILSPRHPDKHPSKHSILSLKTLPKIEYFSGNIAVLSGLSNDIYFHWILDVLPKIGLLQKAGFQLSEIDGFIVRDRLPFQRETLDILNIPETSRIDPLKHPHIRGDRLIVP
ncbi:MAG: tetratricopeptide repeat protein, partial [Limnospira sp.]